MNIENERAKEKKHVWRNYIRATMFLVTLLFLVIGILFYMLIPDLQISPGTEKSLLLIVSILSLAALFAWIFWHRPARKRYTKEYKEELEKSKISIFLNGRAFRVCQFLMILLALGVGWYIGHHRPAQEILMAEPKKIYKTIHISSEKSTAIPRSTEAKTHEIASVNDVHRGTTNTSSDRTMEDSFEESTDTVRENTADDTLDDQVNLTDTSEALNPDSQQIMEESDQMLKEAEIIRARIATTMARVNQKINQTMPKLVRHLQSLSVEEQTEKILRTQDMFSNRTGIFSLFKDIPSEMLDGAWQNYLDRLVQHGYTLPPGIE